MNKLYLTLGLLLTSFGFSTNAIAQEVSPTEALQKYGFPEQNIGFPEPKRFPEQNIGFPEQKSLPEQNIQNIFSEVDKTKVLEECNLIPPIMPSIVSESPNSNCLQNNPVNPPENNPNYIWGNNPADPSCMYAGFCTPGTQEWVIQQNIIRNNNNNNDYNDLIQQGIIRNNDYNNIIQQNVIRNNDYNNLIQQNLIQNVTIPDYQNQMQNIVLPNVINPNVIRPNF